MIVQTEPRISSLASQHLTLLHSERPKIAYNQLLQLCTARTLFLILITVRLYTVISEVCRWQTNEKQRKTDIHLTDQ